MPPNPRPTRFVAVLATALTAATTATCAPAGESEAERLERLQDMVDQTRREFPDVEGIDAATALTLARSDAVVFVDVREEVERAVSTLPGAITLDQFRAASADHAGKTVVTYCTVGVRSAQAARELAREGHDVRNFEGSIVAWTHAGGELVGPDGATRRVHVYGSRWNLIADGYDAVW